MDTTRRAEMTSKGGARASKHAARVHGMPGWWSPHALALRRHEGLSHFVWGEVLGPQGSLEVRDHKSKHWGDGKLHYKIVVANLALALWST